MKHIFLKWVLLSTYTVATLSYAAEVPVEDLTQSSSSSSALPSPITEGAGETPSFRSSSSSKKIRSTTDTSLPLEQRVAILERKLDNLLELDSIGQINRLQTEVERLRGQIEVQEHNLKQLTEQVKAQYQDLSKRSEKAPAKTTTDPVEKNTPTSKPKTPTATNPSEKLAYDAAISLLKKRDYVRANTDLQRYLEDYPAGQYTASAHYWLGEIYSYQGQPDLAIKEYKTVVTKFPNDTKVPDALLKLGLAYDDAGDKDKARTSLNRVIKEFPNTETAQLATERLKKIQPSASD